ncbi:unnamed protein product [Cladocopium goreaui]|uniref:Anion transporter 2, chloroplastic n=1 Tax=Cladocopium goreaui TaxID=2562237 RepID=A0A9P1GFM8_9DINO|nr:unnamed protein product [Cladocopium goreaui]
MLEPFAAFALELDRLVPATGRCPQGRPRRPRDRRDPRDLRAPWAAPCDAIGRIGRCSAVMAASLAYTTKGRRKHGQRGRSGLVGRQSFPWLSGGFKGGEDTSASRWWRTHPRAGDLLIGWVMHPNLTKGNKLDLEVDFSTSTGGIWRSRALSFQGKFHSMVQDAKLTLQDDMTVLIGRMEHETSLGIEGTVIYERKEGGRFILQPLPECYLEWWAQLKAKLSPEEPPGLIVLSDDGSFSGDSPEDSSDYPDITSPEQLRKFLLRKITGQSRPSGNGSKMTRRQEILGKFTLRPDEVKTYLDRYVICQDAAKEMLSVAICDHYNRAKEELQIDLDSSSSTKAKMLSESGETKESKEVKETAEDKTKPEKAKDGDAQTAGEGESTTMVNSEGNDAESTEVQFTDTDEDVILLKLNGDKVVEYVNGELDMEEVKRFDIDLNERKYHDESGSGHFKDDADVSALQRRIQALFARAKMQMLKPKRVKNYTKPNILLLGPTGSGKTYLLRNLADLIGVPFVKADATKFTETGYVGRDADEVMGELLQAADGDVELAQVGIVYVDEIDKVCSEGEGRSSSFRQATQSTFLKLMEDTEVTVGSPGPRMMLGALGGDKGQKMSTRHVLFVFSGAFSKLDEKLKEEHKRNMKGFGFAKGDVSADETEPEDVQSMLHKVRRIGESRHGTGIRGTASGASCAASLVKRGPVPSAHESRRWCHGTADR